LSDIATPIAEDITEDADRFKVAKNILM